MLRLFAVFIFLFVLKLNGYSQNYENHINSVEAVVEGINNSDYKVVKKSWGLIGKVLIRQKKLEQEYLPFTQKYGQVVIDTIIFTSKYSATAQLTTPAFASKRTFMQFIFNEKGKLQGMGFGYPTFVYRNTGELKNHKDDAHQIDSVVQKTIRSTGQYSFNGCILVSSGDSILYKKNVGYLNFQDSLALNDSSLFLLASCSKQFTALAIMQLQERGKLNCSDQVRKYLPNFPYPEITIEQLLTHTSGLPDYMALLKKHWDHSKFATNEDILTLFAEQKPELLFNSGDRWDYSNTGYVVLSSIIQKISNQTYGAFLKENIFMPLNMDQSIVYHRRIQKDSLSNYASGHVFSAQRNKFVLPDSLSRYDYVSFMDGITGDDGVSSSILDLQKWNDGLKQNAILSEESTKRMNTPYVLKNGKPTNYGYGVFLTQGDNIQDLEYHTGSWPGYSTLIMRMPDSDKTIIFLSNNAYYNMAALVDEIAAIVL
ncbi:serine hydrolase [Cryomorpha ignava]|uniref:Serine hydrolase n=1 Tax=Cryomorpha ignava TaxID=101383 RepID=A0A7K3WRA1_9FLAO|nr:serine hydrolase [Cryomorpha ignava]NEN24209.1 serine hydrolase [Cryomorpha ignava]